MVIFDDFVIEIDFSLYFDLIIWVGARSEYDDFVEREVKESSIILLNIELEHLRINASLPFHHRDPFDRILIAQAMAENLPIMTVDSIFNQYPIRLI